MATRSAPAPTSIHTKSGGPPSRITREHERSLQAAGARTEGLDPSKHTLAATGEHGRRRALPGPRVPAPHPGAQLARGRRRSSRSRSGSGACTAMRSIALR